MLTFMEYTTMYLELRTVYSIAKYVNIMYFINNSGHKFGIIINV